MHRSQNRAALVTGVSRRAGIGTAIVKALAQDGVKVFMTYYRPYDNESGLAGDPDDPAILMAELNAAGCLVDGMEVDLSKPDAPAALFEIMESRFSAVNILVNNATCSLRDGIDNLNAVLLDKHYAVNIRGMALLCVEFVRRYKLNKQDFAFGRIINLTSGQSLGPMPGELAYAATKGAVEAFTVSLSAEVASLGVTVNAVDPGTTDTGWIPPDLAERWKSEAPKGRVGLPEDAARLIRFLASEDGDWITGQVIHSRGGY